MHSSTLHLPSGRSHSPTAELLLLALPMIGMTVSRMLMNFIDFAMVSQLGTAAKAAISPSTIFLFVLSGIGMGMAQSVQTFVSQAIGRGEQQRAGSYVWQSMYIALFSGLLTAPVVILVPVWFAAWGKLAGHPPDVLKFEITFLSIALWSVAPATACGGLDAFYNGIRKPIVSFFAVIAGLLTITVGNYLLIFGKLGAPELGVAGSGISTVLAWCARLAVLLVPLIFSGDMHRRYNTGAARLRWKELGEIARIGWPISAQWLVDLGAWVVFLHLMMPHYGEIAMASATDAIQYMHFSFMPALGIGMALTTQVGNAIGARRPEEAVMRVRVARRVVMLYMAVMALVFVLFGRQIGGLLSTDSAVIAASAHALLWVALFQISDAICIIYSFAARGAGDTRVPALLFAVCCWLIFVLGGMLTVYLAPNWGVNGPWAMCTLYIIVLGVLLWRRFHSERWRSIRIFDRAAPQTAPQVQADLAEAPIGEPALVTATTAE